MNDSFSAPDAMNESFMTSAAEPDPPPPPTRAYPPPPSRARPP
ncbi:hypothetical protein [Amycolatopsis kentuckyensis]